MVKTVRPQDPDQPLFLPPVLADRMPEDHLTRLVRDVVDSLNPTTVEVTYTEGAAQ